jgi:hypothetical protein
MALNGTLGRKNAKRAHAVTATVTADKGDGIKIVSSNLKVVAEGLEGPMPTT